MNMEASNIRGLVGQSSSPPTVARTVRILLVDHDTESLMFLASQFEQQSNIIVTTTESSNVALRILREKTIDYDAVIADRHMPDMNIYEFVHEVHCLNISIMLVDEGKTMDSVREAILHHKVCFVFSKPLSHLDLESFWQHIPRVTLTNTIQSNSNKSRMSWTPRLHQKFLNAIQRLGKDATPNRILNMMDESDLNYHQVASHLQKHRNQTKNSANLPRGSGPYMPAAPTNDVPSGHLSTGLQGGNRMNGEGSGNRFV